MVIALLPVLMCYKIPVVEYGTSTVLIAILMIPAMIYSLNSSGYDKKLLKIIFPFFIYVTYVLTKSSSINILLQISIVVHFVAIINGMVIVDKLKSYIIRITILASIIVLAQTVVHYAIGYHIPCIYFPGILDTLKEQYFSGIYTGVSRWGGMYRPCAFFLEPAHMAQYSFVGLLLALFSDDVPMKKKIVISVGILATSSGIGILCTSLCWILWAYITKVDGSFLDKLVNFSKYAILGTIVYYMLLQIPYFKNAVNRFTVKEDGEYNAVDGRLFFWDRYIGDASTSQLLWGFGYDALPDSFFTGMMTVLYAYGYVGIILFYASLLILLFGLKGISRYIILIYIGLTFSSDVVGFIWIIYLLGVSLALNYKYSYGK